MNNQAISGRQMKYFIALFIIGSSLILNSATKAKQDSWLCMIFATIAIIPVILIYNAILRLYPGENLYQIVINIFGNFFGKIICFIYVIYALHLGSLVLNIFADFIHIVNMPETPKIVIAWFMIIPCIYIVYSGVAVAGRLAKFLYIFLFAFVTLTVFLSLKNMEFSNALPMLSSEFSTLFDSTLTVFSLPLGESVIFLTIFSLDAKENYLKTFKNGIILAMIILISANLRNLFVLGASGLGVFPFASYEAVSVIALGEFLTRIEVLIAINLLIAGFFKICACCFSSAIGLSKIFNVSEYKYFVTPASMIIITLFGLLFKNTQESFDFIEIYKLYVIPYQVVIPLIILIAGLIKTKTQKKLLAA